MAKHLRMMCIKTLTDSVIPSYYAADDNDDDEEEEEEEDDDKDSDDDETLCPLSFIMSSQFHKPP
jgi:hypothetical protein